MNELADWQESNARYLGEAISWLRLRLERHSSGGGTSGRLSPYPFKKESPSLWERMVSKSRTQPSHPGPLLLSKTAPAGTLPAASQESSPGTDLFAAQPNVLPPALLMLGRRLALSPFEMQILLLCAAMELDTSIAALCARAQDDPTRPFPTFGLALSLFDEPAWDMLSPERPLRFWRLIEINQPGAHPLTTSPLRADERIVSYLKGLNYLDDRLAHLLAPIEAEPGIQLPASQSAQVDTIVRSLKQAANTPTLPVIQLLGRDSPSKQLIASQAALALGLDVYRIAAEAIPAPSAELETFTRLWQRECLLLPITLYLDAHELDAGAAAPAAALNRFLSRTEGVVFLDAHDVWSGQGRPTLLLDIAKPTPAEQQAKWQALLGAKAEVNTAGFAGQFNLSFSDIQEISQTALSGAPDDASGLEEQLWQACLSRTRPRLDTLAERLEPRATWDDIVLPQAELHLLRQIAGQVGQRSKVYDQWEFRHKISRGLGISVLFTGESGTGKTMAAEVIANDLRLNLHRIDLSAVVSKYIGETEKNLRRLFDAAEDGGAILFFDEADALFGKRSEVKDSHDRYANIEVNYLLQRMETFGGLAILASNMRSALDTAFLRRLRFIVTFPFPAPPERKAIWQKVFPAPVPTAALDYDRLARLNLTGGSIRNVALNAAFLAAQTNSPVSMPIVLGAARVEYRKLDLPVNEADFRIKPIMAATA